MENQDLAFATAAELSKLLRTRQASSVELARFFLDRLERLGPSYNALAELTRARAMTQARRADALLRRKLRAAELVPPLLGVPYGAKDLLATRGIPTRWGAPPYRDQVFDYDATVVQRLEKAGAVLVGKLAMVELAGGGGYQHPSASLHGPGLNPWNVERWSGGSSSGSGSAVAAGLVPFALGSETWGSIVTPAAYCGLSGLRPTFGLVSRYGAMELAWSMDKVGPMAHSAEDCGRVLAALSGPDGLDLTVEQSFTFRPHRTRRQFRLGILPADFEGAEDIRAPFQKALAVLEKNGCDLVPVELPEAPYAETAITLLKGEEAAAHRELISSPRLDELVDSAQREGLRKSLSTTAGDYVRAQQKRLQITQDVLGLFNRFDALVSTSLVIEAVTLDTNLQTAFRRRGGYSVLGALCGVPNITVPMGFGAQGLPLGLSLTGNRFHENTILQLAMLYQRETDWHQLRPPAPSE